MYIDEYVIKRGSRLFIGGRQILPSDIHIVCTQEQKEALLKNKTIKKKKGESNDNNDQKPQAAG